MLDQWRPSEAEKEVVFLLFKGFSLKDIPEVRGTTGKMARAVERVFTPSRA
ncbi:hypothetical protein [Pseudoxanthomonas gei]|uniref:hypothetical protein n=1 Tax=Pseudoxanthomonas gei TaxID=1383030 RepID=UPI00139102D2|nr:hypothetical protein [Pseudoxanthomonas gei]